MWELIKKAAFAALEGSVETLGKGKGHV